jgi:hypothetical protein
MSVASSPAPVCGNTDYIVRFAFDTEWDAYENKTARFVTENGYIDVLFEGSECPMPQISNVRWVEIGAYAGDLRTTTPAYIPMDRSILCGDNSMHPDPPEDLYNQLLERMAALEMASVSPEAIEKAVSEYLDENPVQGFETDETLTLSKENVLSVNRAFSVEQDNTLPVTSAAVHETVGNINALLATI